MSKRSTPILLVVIGWLTVPVFGIAVAVTKGGDEVGYVLVTSAIAIALAVLMNAQLLLPNPAHCSCCSRPATPWPG